ncbi:MAG: hypothetical protein GF370_04885 [Candidatus Nealsonbacteria bacterium]|nr:hypothetical protein [Candidatus Nealsonbacteria bacterium]
MEEKQTEEKPASPELKTGSDDVKENKNIAVLSYLGILCLVPLLLKKESSFVQFHAKQGLVLMIGWLFIWFPFVGQVLWAILAIFSIWGIINVLEGKKTRLPVVADLAEKFNI